MTIIEAKPNKEGRVVVRLFRTDYDVTNRLINGIATLEVYGEVYKIHADKPVEKKVPAKKAPAKKGKKIAVKKTKDNGAEVNVSFIETPEKD